MKQSSISTYTLSRPKAAITVKLAALCATGKLVQYIKILEKYSQPRDAVSIRKIFLPEQNPRTYMRSAASSKHNNFQQSFVWADNCGSAAFALIELLACADA